MAKCQTDLEDDTCIPFTKDEMLIAAIKKFRFDKYKYSKILASQEYGPFFISRTVRALSGRWLRLNRIHKYTQQWNKQ